MQAGGPRTLASTFLVARVGPAASLWVCWCRRHGHAGCPAVHCQAQASLAPVPRTVQEFEAYRHEDRLVIRTGSATGAYSSMVEKPIPSFALLDIDGSKVRCANCWALARPELEGLGVAGPCWEHEACCPRRPKACAAGRRPANRPCTQTLQPH